MISEEDCIGDFRFEMEQILLIEEQQFSMLKSVMLSSLMPRLDLVRIRNDETPK